MDEEKTNMRSNALQVGYYAAVPHSEDLEQGNQHQFEKSSPLSPNSVRPLIGENRPPPVETILEEIESSEASKSSTGQRPTLDTLQVPFHARHRYTEAPPEGTSPSRASFKSAESRGVKSPKSIKSFFSGHGIKVSRSLQMACIGLVLFISYTILGAVLFYNIETGEREYLILNISDASMAFAEALGEERVVGDRFHRPAMSSMQGFPEMKGPLTTSNGLITVNELEVYLDKVTSDAHIQSRRNPLSLNNDGDNNSEDKTLLSDKFSNVTMLFVRDHNPRQPDDTMIHDVDPKSEFYYTHMLIIEDMMRFLGTGLRKVTTFILRIDADRYFLIVKAAQPTEFLPYVYLSITIVTTIGYGNLAPRSTLGRALLPFFASVGIPLLLFVASSIGQTAKDLISSHVTVSRFWGYINERSLKGIRKVTGNAIPHHHSTIRRLIFIYLIGFVLLVLIPAIPICFDQKWRYVDAVYFCFVTVATIGFGDLTYYEEPRGWADWVIRFCYYSWILFGVVWLTQLFTTSAAFLHQNIRRRDPMRPLKALKYLKRVRRRAFIKTLRESLRLNQQQQRGSKNDANANSATSEMKHKENMSLARQLSEHPELLSRVKTDLECYASKKAIGKLQKRRHASENANGPKFVRPRRLFRSTLNISRDRVDSAMEPATKYRSVEDRSSTKALEAANAITGSPILTDSNYVDADGSMHFSDILRRALTVCETADQGGAGPSAAVDALVPLDAVMAAATSSQESSEVGSLSSVSSSISSDGLLNMVDLIDLLECRRIELTMDNASRLSCHGSQDEESDQNGAKEAAESQERH